MGDSSSSAADENNETRSLGEEVARVVELGKELQDSAASFISRTSREEDSLRQRALALNSTIQRLRSSVASSNFDSRDVDKVMPEEKPVIGLSWEPKLPPLPSRAKNMSQILPDTSTSAVYRPSSELIDGLFVPPDDPRKVNKLLRKQIPNTTGKNWFDMPAQTITPELKKDLQLLKLRSVIDPKRHYKKSDSKSKSLPKYFQVGTVIESASEFYTGRFSKKERRATLADELLADHSLGEYRKRKVQEIEEQNRPVGVDKWKIRGRQSRKRAKERRH